MKKLQISLAVVAMALAVLFSSCSKKKNIESVIPTDSTLLMTLDIGSLVENMGGSFADGITFPESISSVLPEETARALACVKGVDLSRVYVSGYPSGDFAVVASVTDKSDVDMFLDSLGIECESIDGYTVYSEKSLSVLYDDDLLWVVPEGDLAVETVKDIISDAETHGSVADCAWRRDYLAQKRTLNCLLDLGTVPMIETEVLRRLDENTPGYATVEKMLQGTLAMGLGFDGPTMTFTVNAFDKDGAGIGMDAAAYGMKTKPLSPEFLKYLDSGDVLLFAGDVPAGYPWKQVYDSMVSQGYDSESGSGLFDDIVPVLETVEGTVAVACGVRDGLASFKGGPEGYDIVMYVTFKPGKAAECLAKIKESVSKYRSLESQTDGDDLIVTLGSLRLHMGVRGDALVVADRNLTDTGRTVFTPDDFKDLSSLVLLRLDKSSDLCSQLGLPFGIFSKCRMADEYTFELTVTETGISDGLFLKELFDYFHQ